MACVDAAAMMMSAHCVVDVSGMTISPERPSAAAAATSGLIVAAVESSTSNVLTPNSLAAVRIALTNGAAKPSGNVRGFATIPTRSQSGAISRRRPNHFAPSDAS